MNEDLNRARAAIVARAALFSDALRNAVEVQARPDAFPRYLDGMLDGVRAIQSEIESLAPAIPDFERWYARHRETFATDPLMQWARTARSKDLHSDDLAGDSTAVVELIAAYRIEPIARWTLDDLFATVDDIRNEIPPQHLTPHVVDNGVLRILRRWVDRDLPDWDVVSALAEIDNRLGDIVFDFLSFCEPGENSVQSPTPDNQAEPPVRQCVERATYVAVHDGWTLHASAVKNQSAKALADSVARELRGSPVVLLPNNPDRFDDIARVMFGHASAQLRTQGSHPFTATFLSGGVPIDIQSVAFTSRAQKYAFVREQAEHARGIGADAVIYAGEAWVKPTEKLAGSHGNKTDAVGEVLTLFGANAKGSVVKLESRIRRGFIRRGKIKPMAEPTESEHALPSMLAPFLEQWGRLDDLSLPVDADFTLDTIPRA